MLAPSLERVDALLADQPDLAVAWERAFGWARRPEPSVEDFAKAEKLADEFGADRGPNWARDHRANAVHQFAMLEMGKRQSALCEHRVESLQCRKMVANG